MDVSLFVKGRMGGNEDDCMDIKLVVLMSVGFEPTPTKTTALTLRLRPLGHDIDDVSQNQYNTYPVSFYTYNNKTHP